MGRFFGRIFMRLLVPILIVAIAWSPVQIALAANTTLVPCNQSPAFQQRQSSAAAKGYYFDKPFAAYSSELLCGEDGLPHLPIQVDRAVDVAIPIALFLYIAGFIGWSGRAYLQAANKAENPQEKEIFIDLALAIVSVFKGVVWPLLALQELVTGQLTAKDNEISVSPR
jgi:photosystem I subunit 3